MIVNNNSIPKAEPATTQLVYLILAHGQPELLSKLVEALDNERAHLA